MSFFIECSRCKVKSPPTTSTVYPPIGWTSQTVVTQTTFSCPACSKETGATSPSPWKF